MKFGLPPFLGGRKREEARKRKPTNATAPTVRKKYRPYSDGIATPSTINTKATRMDPSPALIAD